MIHPPDALWAVIGAALLLIPSPLRFLGRGGFPLKGALMLGLNIGSIIEEVQLVLAEAVALVAIVAVLSDGKEDPGEADRVAALLKEVILPLPIPESLKNLLENPVLLKFIAEALLSAVRQQKDATNG